MNTTKKIITLAVILGLAVLSFILFGGQMNNKTASSTASSAVSSIMSKVSEATFKDNKTIELAPKDLSIWSASENKFDTSTVLPEGFTGINGSKFYQNPQAGDGVNYILQVVNSTFPQSVTAKSELELFKAAIKLNSNPNNDNFYKFKSIFRTPNEGGGYSKNYIKDIAFTKPANFDSFRVVATKDGQSESMDPVVNIMGQRGNDYFLLENRLIEFKPMEQLDKAKAACNNSNVDKCIDNKYAAAIETFLTPELIKTKIEQAIAALN